MGKESTMSAIQPAQIPALHPPKMTGAFMKVTSLSSTSYQSIFLTHISEQGGRI